MTVGRDFSGEVVALGKAVKNVAVGDQVWGVVSPQRQGSHAEYVVAAASNVRHKGVWNMMKKLTIRKTTIMFVVYGLYTINIFLKMSLIQFS